MGDGRRGAQEKMHAKGGGGGGRLNFSKTRPSSRFCGFRFCTLFIRYTFCLTKVRSLQGGAIMAKNSRQQAFLLTPRIHGDIVCCGTCVVYIYLGSLPSFQGVTSALMCSLGERTADGHLRSRCDGPTSAMAAAACQTAEFC